MTLLHYLFVLWILIILLYFKDNLLYQKIKEIKTVKCFVKDKSTFSKEYPISYSNIGFDYNYESLVFTKKILNIQLTKNYNLSIPENIINTSFFNNIKINDSVILKTQYITLIPKFKFLKFKKNEKILEITSLENGVKIFI